MNGDDLEVIQMAADTERSAVKVSMIRKNKEILFQDGQLVMYHLQQNYHHERGKSNESNSEVAPYIASSMPNLVGRERGSTLNPN